MVTIQQAVQEIVSHQTFVEKHLQEEIINLSAYAKQIKPEVEKYVKKKVKLNSVVVALSRIKLQPLIIPKLFDQESYFRIYTNIVSVTAIKSPSNLRVAQKIALKAIGENEYLNYVVGEKKITIITSKKYYQILKSKLEKTVKIFDNLGVITLKAPKDSVTTPSTIYQLTKRLSFKNINILEMLTLLREIHFLLAEKDIMIAGEEFRKLINYYKEQ